MEKSLTMRGGQTPMQPYWHTLLKKVVNGVGLCLMEGPWLQLSIVTA